MSYEAHIDRKLSKVPGDAWVPKHIYALIDPDTNQVRYVGKSIRPELRLQNHMNDVSNCHRSHWLQSLKRKGAMPRMVILETIEGEWPWQEVERFWIKRGRALGWPLTNNTAGGDGVDGLPEEARERLRSAWLGRKHTPETLVKLSAASKGRTKTDEQKSHMRKLMQGRHITWADRLSEAVSKFSHEQADQIMGRLNAGETVAALAAEFGVHRTTISKIKGGTYFKQASQNLARVQAKSADLFAQEAA